MSDLFEGMGVSADADRAGRPSARAPTGLGDSATIADAIQASAGISPCGQYRFWLGRKWDHGSFSLPVVMLNPSTADASTDDPTIRRCMGFARRENFGGVRVFNLFAYRATSPADMKAAHDPVGPGNDDYLNEAFDIARCSDIPVLAAWGTHGSFMRRDETVERFAADHRVRLVCLGTTTAGHPRHPLYVKGDQPFEPYPAQAMSAREGQDPQGLGAEPEWPGDADAPGDDQ